MFGQSLTLCGIPASCFVASLQNGRFLHLFNYFGPQLGIRLRLCNFQDNELSDFNLVLQHSPSFMTCYMWFWSYFPYHLQRILLTDYALATAHTQIGTLTPHTIHRFTKSITLVLLIKQSTRKYHSLFVDVFGLDYRGDRQYKIFGAVKYNFFAKHDVILTMAANR